MRATAKTTHDLGVPMKTLPTLEAKCRRCGGTFSHPSLGDFSYGEALLCSESGRYYVTLDGFSAVAQRVRATLTSPEPGELWKALAALADPVEGEALSATIRCPTCSSDDLASWGGRVTGTREVAEASFDTLVLGL